MISPGSARMRTLWEPKRLQTHSVSVSSRSLVLIQLESYTLRAWCHPRRRVDGAPSDDRRLRHRRTHVIEPIQRLVHVFHRVGGAETLVHGHHATFEVSEIEAPIQADSGEPSVHLEIELLSRPTKV